MLIIINFTPDCHATNQSSWSQAVPIINNDFDTITILDSTDGNELDVFPLGIIDKISIYPSDTEMK